MSTSKIYTEKEIRKQILNKVKPENIKKAGKHWVGQIIFKGSLIGMVTIPNDHRRDMFHNKTNKIAKSLKIEPNQFSDLIKCTLSSEEYYKIIEEKQNSNLL